MLNWVENRLQAKGLKNRVHSCSQSSNQAEKNTQRENMCDIIFEKTKGVSRNNCSKGSFKKVLCEISQIHKKKCAGVSFFDKVFDNFLQICSFFKNEALVQVFSCEFCKIRENTFFSEHRQTTASDYSKERRIGKRNCKF